MNQDKKVVKISDIVDSQIPDFILVENPNFAEFLKQYYISQEFQGSSIDLAENLVSYKNIETFDSVGLITSTTLTESVSFFDDEIFVESTNGWPSEYGLLKIDNEIITYTGITSTSFTGCIRGFSGVESLSNDNSGYLKFSSTEADQHEDNSVVQNLSNLFLIDFFKKIKYQFTPGFEEVDFDPRINPQNFISRAKDFYKTKGTEEAFKILFKVLYGEKVEVIKPKDFISTPSDAKWIVVERFIGELLEGNPSDLDGQTLYQDRNEDGSILDANGSIYRVSSFSKDNSQYYNIDIFSGYSNNLNPKGSIFGTFNVTPKTYVITDVPSGSDVIRVFSTNGFNNSGTISIDGVQITYTDKTNTEFIGCTGVVNNIRLSSIVNGTNYVYSYNTDGSLVKFRLLNTISEIDYNNTKLAFENDLLKVENIGITKSNVFTKSLKYNVPTIIHGGEVYGNLPQNTFGVDKTSGVVKTKYPNYLTNGDRVEVYSITTNSRVYTTSVSNVNNDTTFSFTLDITSGLTEGHIVKFRRITNLSSSSTYTNINNKFLTNIQSSYEDDENYYVASNGFFSGNINPYRRKFSFTVENNEELGISTTLLGNHNFYDGDLVVVDSYSYSIIEPGFQFNNNAGITTGLYLHVKKLDSDQIQLSYTSNDLLEDRYINFSESDSEGNIVSSIRNISLTHHTIYNKDLYPNKLFKKIPKVPQFPLIKEDTPSGSIGILVNGVEIQSPKSFDKIYNGPIEKIEVLNNGEKYDLLNPPKFSIDLGSDTTTKVFPSLEGSLEKIAVLDGGYDYVETPIVEIVGGNNSEVKTSVKIKSVQKDITFNANDSSVVNTLDPENRFIFGVEHRLFTGDAVIYNSQGNQPIGIGVEVEDGFLVDDGVYYISDVGAGTSFRLFPTYNDAISGINTINLRTRGRGIQKFTTVKKINVIDEVNILDFGGKFENKVLPFTTKNVNRFDDIISIENHGFNDSEEVSYGFTGTSLTGLSTTTYYYVRKIDENSFQLYSNKKLTGSPVNINYTSAQQNSLYTISYSPVRVTIKGKLTSTGISTIGFDAEIAPVIRGSITDLRIGSSKNYGNTLFNTEDYPRIDIIKGKSCTLKPIISNGKIIDVIVVTQGQNYYNSVDIKINGIGIGAELYPVISDGKVIDVKVIKTGIGYDNFTTLDVIEVGSGAYFKSNIKKWTINEVSKYSSSALNTGILVGSNYSQKSQIGIYYLTTNISNSLGITSTTHSPIIGWAYDGCPIYGPFAYSNTNGTGNIIRMRSSYRKSVTSPSNSNSTNLDTIEDYVYQEGLGTLDEHNGRYCVTPEYPNGVYAYFSTSTYPFFIGTKYSFLPVKENFSTKYNQDLNINDFDIVKHSYPYYVEDLQNYNDYFDFYPSIEKEDFIVSNIQSGSVDSIDVVYPGSGYKIGDKIRFDNSGTSGFGAEAVVSEIIGVGVNSISSNVLQYSNIVFTNDGDRIVGIATTNLNIKNNYFVNISDISEKYKSLEGFKKISTQSFSTLLTETLPSGSGIVTSIKVEDSITNFEVDSRLKISNEILDVIGFDYENNRINVKRTNVLEEHPTQTVVEILDNKFFIENTDDLTLPRKNEVYYFSSDLISVGIGTTPGSGNTLIKYPLGLGVSETRFVRTAGIWMPNHNFKTGEEVDYILGEESTTISTNFGNLESIPNLYIVDLGNSIVGFTTLRRNKNNLDNLVYFTSSGSGQLHKLITKRNVEIGNVSVIETTVYTDNDHNLSLGDEIELDVKVGTTTEFSVTYSSSTSRFSLNTQVNPRIKAYRNQTLVFDLSSTTLSGTKFKFYVDENLQNEYLGTGLTFNEVVKETNKITLNINYQTPSKLYYNLTSKTKEININKSVTSYNTIEIYPSEFNTKKQLVGISSNTFTINLEKTPERDSYVSTGSTTISYSVLSSDINGPIKTAKMTFKGSNYKRLPKIVSIGSSGTDAKLYPYSESIGKITKITPIVGNIYPTDKTLRPSSTLYSILYLKDNYKVNTLSIESGGKNYLIPPLVKLYNKNTNTIYDSFSAFGVLKNSSVDKIVISNPGSGIPEYGNKIVFTENTNGLKILEATKQENSPGVFTVSLRVETPLSGFTTSNPIPFDVGDEIFVEGIISTGNGYNSEFYSYDYFEVVGIQTSFSSPDQSIIRYNIIGDPGSPISYDFATVSNRKDMPIVNLELVVNEFYPNEGIDDTRVVNNTSGETNKFYVKVYKSDEIEVNDSIEGKISSSKGIVLKKEDYNSSFKVSESFSKELGSKENRSYLSSILQKIQDSNYYQDFSYSLKSNQQITSWESPVSDLSHISGFKKFGDMVVESVGISSIKTDDISSINLSLDSYVNVNTINDIDLVLEDVDQNNNLYSEILTFNTLKLSDYLLSKENRVLSIDDISTSFDNDATFASLVVNVLPTFGSGSFIAKYFVFIESTTSFYTDFELPLLAEIYLAKEGTKVNLISYSYFEDTPLGSFFTQINPTNPDEILLEFIPYNINNIYSANTINDVVQLDQNKTETNYGHVKNIGITSYFSGSVAPLQNYINLISSSSCNSGNLYVGIGTTNGYISEFVEMAFVWDGSQVITSVYSETEIKNLGTIGIVENGGNISVSFTGLSGVDTFVYINSHLLVNTNTNPQSINLDFGRLNSSRVQFTNSNLNPVTITSFSSEYGASKFVIEVKKTVGSVVSYNMVQINSVHYNVIEGQDKYLNNIDYSIIGNFDDINFKTIYDSNADTYTLVYYPNELATYDIKFYEKNIVRATNPLLQ